MSLLKLPQKGPAAWRLRGVVWVQRKSKTQENRFSSIVCQEDQR